MARRIGGGLAGLAGNITNVFQAKGASTRVFELLERDPRIPPAVSLPTTTTMDVCDTYARSHIIVHMQIISEIGGQHVH